MDPLCALGDGHGMDPLCVLGDGPDPLAVLAEDEGAALAVDPLQALADDDDPLAVLAPIAEPLDCLRQERRLRQRTGSQKPQPKAAQGKPRASRVRNTSRATEASSHSSSAAEAAQAAKAAQGKPKASTASTRDQLEAHLQIAVATLPGRFAHKHVGMIWSHLCHRIAGTPVIGSEKMNDIAGLITPKFCRASTLNCALLCLTNQDKQHALLVNGEHSCAARVTEAIDIGKKCIAIGTCSWDETEQHMQLRAAGFAAPIPLLRTYLDAKARGESTEGMAMQTLAQNSSIDIAVTSTLEIIFSENLVCPLKHLTGMKAPFLWAALAPHMPFPLMRSTWLTRMSLVVMIFMCDRASNNKKMLRYIVYTRHSIILIIVVFCHGHLIHTCSSAQAAVLDMDAKEYSSPPLLVAAPVGPAAAADPLVPAQRKRKPVLLTLMSSLVRGAHLARQASYWRSFESKFEFHILQSGRLVTTEEVNNATDEQCHVWQRNLERNTLWLQLFGYFGQAARNNKKPTARDKSCQILLELCGKCCWDCAPDQPLVILVFPHNLYNTLAEAMRLVATHAKCVFMSRRPELPAEGRWTGLAGSASWHGGLGAFFGMLTTCLPKPKKPAAVAVADHAAEEDPDAIVRAAVDPNVVRTFNSARIEAFTRWCVQPGRRCVLQCYLLVQTNAHLRRVLAFVFKYFGISASKPMSRQQLSEVSDRYMLPEDDLEAEQIDPTCPPFLEWCEGSRVRRCLEALTSMLGNIEEAGYEWFLEELRLLFGSTVDGRIDDSVYSLARRCITTGAAKAWWHLYENSSHSPMGQLFATAHPGLTAEEQQTRSEGLLSTTCPSCWDTGFTAPFLLERCGCNATMDVCDEVIVASAASLVRTPPRRNELVATAKRVNICIFGLECGHGQTRKEILSSLALGAPKDFVTVCASRTMAGAKRNHQLAFGDATTEGQRRTRRRQAVSACLSTASGPYRTNGYFLYKNSQARAWASSQQPGTVCGNLLFEAQVKLKWSMLAADLRALYGAKARCLNRAHAPPPAHHDPNVAASVEPLEPEVKGPWGLGNSVEAIIPDDLVRAKADGLLRSNAVEDFKLKYGTAHQPDPPLEDEMDACPQAKKTCVELGLCRRSVGPNWMQVDALHSLLQRYLVASPDDLKHGETLLCVHGWREGTPHRVQVLVLAAWQSLSPRFTITIRCARWGGAAVLHGPSLWSGMDHLALPEALHNEEYLALPLLEPLLPARADLCVNDDAVLEFHHSRWLAAGMYHLSNVADYAWTVAIVSHTPDRLRGLWLGEVKPPGAHALWPKKRQPDDRDRVPNDPLGAVLVSVDDSGSDGEEVDDAQVKAEFATEHGVTLNAIERRMKARLASEKKLPPKPKPKVTWELRKNNVYVGSDTKPRGRLSLLSHWSSKPMLGMTCFYHKEAACSITGDVDSRDRLCQWVANAARWGTAEEHRAASC